MENSVLWKALTALGTNEITISIMIESILVRRAVCKNIYLNTLTAWDTMGKTDCKKPKKREEY